MAKKQIDQLCAMLANGLADGQWEFEPMRVRAHAELGVDPLRERWPRTLVHRVLQKYPFAPPSKLDELQSFLRQDTGFQRAIKTHHYLRRVKLLPTRVKAKFANTAAAFNCPQFRTSHQLAEFLGMSLRQLTWYADVDGYEHTAFESFHRHYTYKRVRKRSGKQRLLEAPKDRLKELQRLILDEIIYSIPPHDAAHGFRPGHSIQTFAEAHVGQQVVMRIDLRHFFPSIHSKRVNAIFKSAGYSRSVSRLLTGLCTNTTWQGALNDPFEMDGCKHLAVPHLPQGAPTSPAIANLCAYRLDCRLSGLAKKFGGFYTRYADDLVFSGNRYFQNRLSKIRIMTGAICLNEGFTIQHRKTRVMPSATRQSVAGVIVNVRPSTGRAEFDTLKATLFNCVRHGTESQNRDNHPRFLAHLRGRIEWVRQIHPKRGEKLLTLFEQL